MSKDAIAQIALDRFAPLEHGEEAASIKTLAHKWGHGRNTIAAAIKRAFKDKLVEVRRTGDGSVPEPVRVKELQDALKKRYPSVNHAIVVAPPDGSSDVVHRSLGYATAYDLGSFIDHNITIGLGSGRGPYYTVMGLSRLQRLHRDSITLMSLTGAVYPEAHDKSLNALLDADFHTGLMGVCFSQPLNQRMISHPIAPSNIKAVRATTWLDERQFKEHVPHLAIVGLGVLRRGHRFFDVVQSGIPGPALVPIFKDLQELSTLAASYSTDTYCPVADICNRLFFVEQSRDHYKKKSERMSASDQKKIMSLIERVNEKLLTINEEQLGRISGGLCLVAGTPSKAVAIRTLLDNGELRPPKVRIKIICVDAPTTELILAA